MKVKMHSEIEKKLKELYQRYHLIQSFIDMNKLKLDDDYKKINFAYYCIVGQTVESLGILLEQGYFTSVAALTRTILELHIKSFYLEFIEKPKQSDISDFLSEKINFPIFFEMAKSLDAFKTEDGKNFGGTFGQFTKKQLGSYNKLSLFTHGKGELLQAYFDNPRFGFSVQTKVELLQNINFYYSTLSLLLFYVQDMDDAVNILLADIMASEDYKNEMQNQSPI